GRRRPRRADRPPAAVDRRQALRRLDGPAAEPPAPDPAALPPGTAVAAVVGRRTRHGRQAATPGPRLTPRTGPRNRAPRPPSPTVRSPAPSWPCPWPYWRRFRPWRAGQP